LAILRNNKATKPIKAVIETGEKLAKKTTIPQVKEKKYIIDKYRQKNLGECGYI